MLAAIVESSEDAIISKNLQGTITSWNAGAQRLFGYAPEEIIGQPILRIIPPELQAEEAQILASLRRGQRIEHFETVRVTKDKRRIDVSLTISPIRDAKGVVIGASKIARDISERKRSEAELEKARGLLAEQAAGLEKTVAERTAQLRETVAELEAFSYTLSHDLRSPLRAISNFAQIVLEDYGSTLAPEPAELLNKVLGAAGRMEQLMQDVLAFSRISRQPIELGRVDLDRLVSEIALERPELQSAGTQIHIEHPLLPVQGHAPSLNQCLTNLLSNAVKFVAPGVGPRVRIFTQPIDGRVRLWVEDNGIGIEPEAQHRIYEIFQRLSAKYEGTGIGLAIVKKAAERMGGATGFESQPGKGSRFWIELPQVQ